jgi:surface antigen
MKVAILAAIIAGTVTSAQAFTGRTTLCRSYSDGVFIERMAPTSSTTPGRPSARGKPPKNEDFDRFHVS